jgi:hypothetical protein
MRWAAIYLNDYPYTVIGAWQEKTDCYDGWDVNIFCHLRDASRHDKLRRSPLTLLATRNQWISIPSASGSAWRGADAPLRSTDKEACPIWDIVQSASLRP